MRAQNEIVENANRANPVPGGVWCALCEVALPSEAHRAAHEAGGKHFARRVKSATGKKDLVAEANTAFESLDRLNAWLVAFGRAPAPSKAQAVKSLRGIHINIYDLVAGNMGKVHKSVVELARYTFKHKLVFPRKQAKSEGLRVFLRQIAMIQGKDKTLVEIPDGGM